MSAKFALRFTLVLCVIMLLSTLAVSSAVSAQEVTHDNPILDSTPGQTIQWGSPVPGGPGFISVSPFGFTPYRSDMIRSYQYTRLFNGGDVDGEYLAPVNLPHGATITKVVFFYYDTLPAEDISFFFGRLNLFNGSPQDVAHAYPTISGGYGYIEAEIFQPLVDNQLFSYYLDVVIPAGNSSNLSLMNVRIDYDYPVFLPTVQK